MSVIESDRNYIFIHNPKCAGTSMEAICGGQGHHTIWEYSQEVDLDNYFKFMFVRDPYSRIVSSYNAIKKSRKIFAGRYAETNFPIDFTEVIDKGFDNFVKHLPLLFNFNLDKFSIKTLPTKQHVAVHVAPQYLFGHIDGEIYLDFVGRFEKLKYDWSILQKEFGFRNLPHLNKGKKDSLKKLATNKSTVNLINEIYEKDFELFNYKRL